MSEDRQLIAQLTDKNKRLETELKSARMAHKASNSGVSGKAWLILDHSLQPKEEEESWIATYLDMMTLLLVLLIVMLAFAGKGDLVSGLGSMGAAVVTEELSGAKTSKLLGEAKMLPKSDLAQADGLQSELAALGIKGVFDKENEADAPSLSDLGYDQLGDDIDVIISAGMVSFRIKSEILFSSGQADLGLAGVTVLQKLIDLLKKNDFQIAVEGHTDSVPICGRYPSNWELSGSRAGSVVRYFEANGIQSARLRAVGFADTQPLEENATAEGRAQNRRVELKMEIPK